MTSRYSPIGLFEEIPPDEGGPIEVYVRSTSMLLNSMFDDDVEESRSSALVEQSLNLQEAGCLVMRGAVRWNRKYP